MRNVASFQVDSRQVGVGDLFFALPGLKSDGHDYLEQVSRQGAVGAVVSTSYTGPDYGLNLVRVDDVLVALQDMARDELLKKRPELVYGVTGSIGKTTTKGFLSTLLSGDQKVVSTPGNANSQIGLPLSIMNHLVDGAGALVLEMGMTDFGQIRRLVEIAPPDIALITTIAHVHAKVFDTLESIVRAKAEIFSSPVTRMGVIPYDLPGKAEVVACGTAMWTFSTVASEADFFLDEVGGELMVYEEGRPCVLGRFCLPGEHNKHNLLAAMAVARLSGVSWESLIARLPMLELPEKRLQRFEKNGVTVISDCYNACEVSIKSVMASLPVLCPNASRRVAVLGPVPDMGRFSESCHEAIGRFSLDHVDLLFCLGADCLPIVREWEVRKRSVHYFEDKQALFSALRDEVRSGDVVLIKGANYTQLWTLVEGLLA